MTPVNHGKIQTYLDAFRTECFKKFLYQISFAGSIG